MTACVSCDRPAVIDSFCLPCAAFQELALTEDEREQTRDLIADFFPDEDGVPQYDLADRVWMALYRAGFDIMNRPVVTP